MGLTYKEQAELLGCSVSTVRRHNTERRQTLYTPEQKAQAASLSYLSDTEIAIRLGIPRSTIRYWRKQKWL